MLNIFKRQSEANSNWKEKAVTRRSENEKLKKRNKEISQSRDNWKSKAENFQNEIDRLNKVLKKNY